MEEYLQFYQVISTLHEFYTKESLKPVSCCVVLSFVASFSSKLLLTKLYLD